MGGKGEGHKPAVVLMVVSCCLPIKIEPWSRSEPNGVLEENAQTMRLYVRATKRRSLQPGKQMPKTLRLVFSFKVDVIPEESAQIGLQ